MYVIQLLYMKIVSAKNNKKENDKFIDTYTSFNMTYFKIKNSIYEMRQPTN